MTYFEVIVSIRLHPQTINIATRWVGYLSSSCCAVSSAPVFRLLRYGGFLEDIGAEVEVNPDDQYQCINVVTRHLRSRDYHVTFPSVSYRAMGRSILSLHYLLLVILLQIIQSYLNLYT